MHQILALILGTKTMEKQTRNPVLICNPPTPTLKCPCDFPVCIYQEEAWESSFRSPKPHLSESLNERVQGLGLRLSRPRPRCYGRTGGGRCRPRRHPPPALALRPPGHRGCLRVGHWAIGSSASHTLRSSFPLLLGEE